jgi:uncharacterized membrane protein
MMSSWSSLGRTYAFVHAAGYVVASILFVLVAFRITTPAPPPPSATLTAEGAVAQLAFEQAIWPQLLASNLIYFVAFFALIPIALALREALGGDARAQLTAVAIQTGAMLGILAVLLPLSTQAAAVRFADPSTAVAAVVANNIGGNALWLLVGFLFLVGSGIFAAGRIAWQTAALPTGWAQLSLLVGAVYWFGTAANIVAALADPTTAQLFTRLWQLTVLLGGAVLGPVWAIWLGLALRPARAAVRAPVRA